MDFQKKGYFKLLINFKQFVASALKITLILIFAFLIKFKVMHFHFFVVKSQFLYSFTIDPWLSYIFNQHHFEFVPSFDQNYFKQPFLFIVFIFTFSPKYLKLHSSFFIPFLSFIFAILPFFSPIICGITFIFVSFILYVIFISLKSFNKFSSIAIASKDSLLHFSSSSFCPIFFVIIIFKKWQPDDLKSNFQQFNSNHPTDLQLSPFKPMFVWIMYRIIGIFCPAIFSKYKSMNQLICISYYFKYLPNLTSTLIFNFLTKADYYAKELDLLFVIVPIFVVAAAEYCYSNFFCFRSNTCFCKIMMIDPFSSLYCKYIIKIYLTSNYNNLIILLIVIINFFKQLSTIKQMIKQKTVSRTGMIFNKSYGQHILINAHILNQMVQKSAIRPTDVVLQIGPGTGNLTQLLLQRAKKVIAIQVDPRMVSQLTKRFKYSQYQHKFVLIPGDVMGVQLPFFDICVANIPYQISSPLVFKLLSHQPTFRCAVLMFQKQFAQRLIAKPGSDLYCRLSVNVQLLAKVDHLIKVGRNNFKPPPKVESSIVRIQPKNPRPNIDYLQWDGLLRICFIRKNKTLQAVFKIRTVLEMLHENKEKFIEGLKNQNDVIQKLGNIEIDQQDNMQGKSKNKNKKGNNNDQMDDDQSEQQVQQKMQQQGPQNKVKNEKKQRLQGIKQQIMNVLTKTQYAIKRTSKLSLEDFLILLAEFNSKGIHFR